MKVFSLISLKGMAIVALISALGGAFGGHKVTMWYYQVKLQALISKTQAEKIAALEDNLEQIQMALKADGKTAIEQAAMIEELKRKADELAAKTPNGDAPVLDPDTVDGLRDIFNKSR